MGQQSRESSTEIIFRFSSIFFMIFFFLLFTSMLVEIALSSRTICTAHAEALSIQAMFSKCSECS